MRRAALASSLAAVSMIGATIAAPAGPELWNGARAGASIDDVAAAVPQVEPSTGQMLEDGAQSGLSAPAELAGGPAQAVFFFRGRLLSAVLVESRAIASANPAASFAEARRVVDLARGQYGAPRRCVERRELAALNCTWITGGTVVAVSYHDFGGGSPSLSVLYRPVH